MPEPFGPGQVQSIVDRQVTPVGTNVGATAIAEVPRARTGLGVWLRDLIISLAISAFIIIFIYQPVKVEGTRMMPSLDDQTERSPKKMLVTFAPCAEPVNVMSCARKSCCSRILTDGVAGA